MSCSSSNAPSVTSTELNIDETRASVLWDRYKMHRCAEARTELVEMYMPFVRRLALRAARMIGSEVSVDDLNSAGFFGLMDAVEGFNPERGINFRTFCGYRVRGAILDELRAMDWVPRLVRQNARQHDQVTAKLQARLGRPPSDEEITEALEMTPRQAQRLLNDASPTEIASLDRSHHQTDSARSVPWSELIADKHQENPMQTAMRRELKQLVCRALSRCEQLIIVLYYYEGMTMREIGRTLDISESRVSQMHASILARLKVRMNQVTPTEESALDLISAA